LKDPTLLRSVRLNRSRVDDDLLLAIVKVRYPVRDTFVMAAEVEFTGRRSELETLHKARGRRHGRHSRDG
jgi:hypothetical protein